MAHSNDLPDGHAYKIPGHFIYEGMVMSEYTPLSHLEKVKDMQIFDDDVIISSYPKSGTTMFQEILWLIIHDADVAAANKVCTWERVPFIEYCVTPEDNGLWSAEQTPRPRIVKTHLPERLLPTQVKQKNIKQVSIFRNPKDDLVSYYYFYKSTVTFGKFTGTWGEFFEMVMVDNIHWGNIFDHIIGWWARRNEPNVRIVFFEDILRNPTAEIKKLADFLGKSLSDEDIQKIVLATSFKTMKSNPMTNASNITDEVDATISPFMRKGTVGDWKNHFTVNQSKRFDEMMEKKLAGLGINYTFEL